MHSIFLHYLIDLIYTLGKIFSHHLAFISNINILIALLSFIASFVLCKKLFLVTSKLLLHGLPIEDKTTLQLFLNSIEKIDGVKDIITSKFWGVTTGYLVCNLNLKVRPDAN